MVKTSLALPTLPRIADRFRPHKGVKGLAKGGKGLAKGGKGLAKGGKGLAKGGKGLAT